MSGLPPDVIYLQWGLEETTWCRDCIDEGDVEYLRADYAESCHMEIMHERMADLVAASKAALLNEGQDACCLPILDTCGCWRCMARAAIARAEGELC